MPSASWRALGAERMARRVVSTVSVFWSVATLLSTTRVSSWSGLGQNSSATCSTTRTFWGLELGVFRRLEGLRFLPFFRGMSGKRLPRQLFADVAPVGILFPVPAHLAGCSKQRLLFLEQFQTR